MKLENSADEVVPDPEDVRTRSKRYLSRVISAGGLCWSTTCLVAFLGDHVLSQNTPARPIIGLILISALALASIFSFLLLVLPAFLGNWAYWKTRQRDAMLSVIATGYKRVFVVLIFFFGAAFFGFRYPKTIGFFVPGFLLGLLMSFYGYFLSRQDRVRDSD